MAALATQHVFLTRFNLPSRGTESLIRAQEGWLRSRSQLFERYTVPSVRRQTVRSAAWLVYIDPESPAWLLAAMDTLAGEGLLTWVPRTEVGPQEVREDLDRVLPPAEPDDILVTTNLDNDDGLSPAFVATLLKVTSRQPRTAIYLRAGLIISSGGLYLRDDRRNAFCSVRESRANPMTCWATWHNMLPELMPVVETDGPPSWLQVVHDRNVSNRVRGRLVSAAPYRPIFGDLLDGATEPTRSALLTDSLVNAPRRLLRDTVRTAGKRLLLRTTGKQGLDRVRYFVAAARRGRDGQGYHTL